MTTAVEMRLQIRDRKLLLMEEIDAFDARISQARKDLHWLERERLERRQRLHDIERKER